MMFSCWRGGRIALGLATLVALPLAAATPPPAASAERLVQRQQFRLAYAAAEHGSSTWHTLARGLQDYPLYPYLEAAALQDDIKNATFVEVEKYLEQHAGLIPAERLRREFLAVLAERKDWKNFRKLYHPDLGDELACHALSARLQTGDTLEFDRDLAALWSDPSLPAACVPAEKWAHQHGLLTGERLWQRIDAASERGPASTIRFLADWLPKSERDDALRFVHALEDPVAAVHAAEQWPDKPRGRRAASLAMQRVALRDSDTADAAWPSLQKHFRFSAELKHRILAAMALYVATDFSDDALGRLKDLPTEAHTATTREWRVRVALARGDWDEVLAAIEALDKEQASEDVWRYFRARALIEQGHKEQGIEVLRQLATEVDYYGFLAADWLDEPYAICPLTIEPNTALSARIATRPGIVRALELYQLDMLPEARREWQAAVADMDRPSRLQAAALASRNEWYDRAIFLLAGKAVRYYKQRFPLGHRQTLVEGARAAGIDPAFAFAIIRAESAFVDDARSGANARGLMQLLPETARDVARKNKLSYAGAASLSEPAINIPLGTRYLGAVAARFDGAPWLASAAYNAGPSKAEQWVAARPKLAPDVFVATIPYHETRAYIRRVMAYAVLYDWQLHDGKVQAMSSRMTRIGTPYQPPTAISKRKAVSCPKPIAD